MTMVREVVRGAVKRAVKRDRPVPPRLAGHRRILPPPVKV